MPNTLLTRILGSETKTEGTVRHVITGIESSLPREEIQICVNAPVGDCAVEL